MARRRASARGGTGRRKSAAEARVERLTWALLVLAFALVQLLPREGGVRPPNWLLPAAGAVILLGSGAVQYARRWRVNPVTWIAGTVMLFFALYSLYINPGADFLGLSLLVFAGVIAFGLIADET